MSKINWLKVSNGARGYLGKIKIFSYHWDGTRSRTSTTPPYVAHCRLPGLKSNLGHYETELECKETAERVLEQWLNLTDLTIKK